MSTNGPSDQEIKQRDTLKDMAQSTAKAHGSFLDGPNGPLQLPPLWLYRSSREVAQSGHVATSRCG